MRFAYDYDNNDFFIGVSNRKYYCLLVNDLSKMKHTSTERKGIEKKEKEKEKKRKKVEAIAIK